MHLAAAGLVNELVEARQQGQLSRVLGRWTRYEVLAIDQVGYVPPADVGAELLFQVIAERTERAAILVTTDRITDRAHIIETGTESYRFRRTLEGRQKKREGLVRRSG